MLFFLKSPLPPCHFFPHFTPFVPYIHIFLCLHIYIHTHTHTHRVLVFSFNICRIITFIHNLNFLFNTMFSYFIIQMYYNLSNWNWKVFQWLPVLNSAIVSVRVHVSWLYIGIFFFWLNQHMFLSCFLNLFLIGHSCFTLLCWFLPYNNMN